MAFFLAPSTFPFLDSRTYLGTTRASGLYQGRGQRPRQTLQAARDPARRAPPGASRVFSSRNYPRQVTAPSSRFYGAVDPAGKRVAKNLFARKKKSPLLPQICGRSFKVGNENPCNDARVLFGHRHL